MNKKVLFIVTGIKVGGLETYLLRFLKYKRSDIEPIIIVQSEKKDPSFCKEFINNRAKIIFLPIKPLPLSLFKFYFFLKRENINSICDFRGDFSGLTLMISYLANVKNRIVFYRESVHQFQSSFFKNQYIKILNSLTLYFSTKILSNSVQALKYFFNSDSLKNKYHKIIRNGVYDENELVPINDYRKIYGIPKDAFVIGHIGRYTYAKNHKLILDIAKSLCKKDSKYYFLLCGEGVKNNILPFLNFHNLNKNVITPGLCNNIPSQLCVMDLFLFPSHNEGQPNALIEAMNAGIPILASKIPSIEETVPKEMKSVLLPLGSSNNFKYEIEKIKEGNLPYCTESVKKWSKDYYNQTKRFNEFYKELL